MRGELEVPAELTDRSIPRTIGPMETRLPLHAEHASAGARFGAPCGIELPLDYGDAAAEYDAVRRSVGLIDKSHLGVLEVTGRDRASFLHAMLTNDVKALAAGQGCAAALLDVHGKVQTLLLVWVLDDRILVVTPSGLAETTERDLDRYLFSEKAYFRNATGEFAVFMVAGPDAVSLLARLTGAAVPERPWSHVAASLGGVGGRLVRGGGETGTPEVWVTGPASEAVLLWTALADAGARPVGLTAFDALRIEAGTPLLRHDVDETVLLPEIPFADRVSYTKGCYLGQEVVVRIRDRGHVNRMLRGLILDGDVIPHHGASIVGDGVEVGRVTSAAFSFGLKRPIALGFVRRQQAGPGTAVDVVTDDGARIHATVSDLPFAR
jgi:folate-binding protein YgfZ